MEILKFSFPFGLTNQTEVNISTCCRAYVSVHKPTAYIHALVGMMRLWSMGGGSMHTLFPLYLLLHIANICAGDTAVFMFFSSPCASIDISSLVRTHVGTLVIDSRTSACSHLICISLKVNHLVQNPAV